MRRFCYMLSLPLYFKAAAQKGICSCATSNIQAIGKDMLRKMSGRFMKITGFVFMVTMATIVLLTMGPTKTEYAAFFHLIDGSYSKYSRSNKFNVSMEMTENMMIKSKSYQNLEFLQSKRSDIKSVNTYFDNSKQGGEEVRHIGFLKVHKAASSTMQNMFFRFGLKRNLTFVFTVHPNYFSRLYERHLPLVKPRYRTGYDILCNHGVFNYDIYSSLLPQDTVYLAIVRDPLAVFISAVNYYSQTSQQIDYIALIKGNRLRKLIQRPEIYDKNFFSYTKNAMARDFGFPPTSDPKRVETKLNELGQIFKLVLVVEHFEESLILMKRYMNWKLQDILFLHNNVYGKGQTGADLTLADTKKFKIRNKLDYSLYNFFYKKFWDQFNSERHGIISEVMYFKSVLSSLDRFCNTKEHERDNSVMTVDESKWTEQLTVTFEDCKYMTKGENEFIKLLRQKQGSELRG